VASPRSLCAGTFFSKALGFLLFGRCLERHVRPFGTADGATVMVSQSNQRPGASMGDKSPKAKDRQKKQDAKDKSQKAATAAQKVAAKQVPSKTGK
jgi:hypothetical protein